MGGAAGGMRPAWTRPITITTCGRLRASSGARGWVTRRGACLEQRGPGWRTTAQAANRRMWCGVRGVGCSPEWLTNLGNANANLRQRRFVSIRIRSIKIAIGVRSWSSEQRPYAQAPIIAARIRSGSPAPTAAKRAQAAAT